MTYQLPAIGRQSLLLRLYPSPSLPQRNIYRIRNQQNSQHPRLWRQQQCRFASSSPFIQKRHRHKLAPAASSSTSSSSSSPVQHPSRSKPLPPGAPLPPAEAAGIPDFSDKINPPSTTLPAPLDLPQKDPETTRIKHLFNTGRAYWKFYKTGVKNVFRNARARRRLVRLVRSYDRAKAAPPAMPETKTNRILDERALGVYENYPLTRAEFQFFVRSWADAKKMPIFVALLAIFGEYLPLVVIFCTPLVPYPCRIPSQIEHSRRKREERRHRSFRGQMDAGDVPGPLLSAGEGKGRIVRDVGDLDRTQIYHIGRSLGLYSSVWERLKLKWPPPQLLQHYIQKRIEYLELDDSLFRRDGGVEKLEGHEVVLAAEERGLDVLGRREEELRRDLKEWEKGSKEGRVLSMLLARPNAWEGLKKRQ